MAAEEESEELIEQIYRAPVEPAGWFDVVKGVRDATGSDEVTYLGRPLASRNSPPLFTY